MWMAPWKSAAEVPTKRGPSVAGLLNFRSKALPLAAAIPALDMAMAGVQRRAEGNTTTCDVVGGRRRVGLNGAV